MIFDANAFIGKWPYWPVRCNSAEEVTQQLHAWNIDRAAICSTRSVFVNWADGNSETLASASSHPDALIPFACLGTRELSHAYSAEPYPFETYRRNGFRGIRLYPQHHSYHLLFQSFVDEILEDAASCRWPVLLPLRIIMNWGMPSLDPAAIHSIVERHPRVNWILAGINYLYELQLATSLMLRYETVCLETSCIMGYMAIEKTVQQCGASQLLFGSGAPLQHGAASLTKVLHAKIGYAAQELILGQNLKRLLGESKA